MLATEYPPRLTGTVSCDSFVLLTLDIAASIRGVTDETAIREAEALPRAKCLAWIRQSISKLHSRLPHWTFFLVGRGLPAPPHAFAAVPIAPNGPHPETGRAAVEPSRPFPWPDCFIHTLDDVDLPISRLHEPSDAGIVLELDRAARRPLLLAWYDDMDATADERLELAIAAGIAIPVRSQRSCSCFCTCSCTMSESDSSGEASSRGLTSDDDGESESSERGAMSDCSDRSSSASARRDLAAHLATHDPEPDLEDQGIVMHVEVSGILDPSVDFGTVEDFLAVRERLAEIEWDRAERAETAHLARAAGRKAAAWLKGISESASAVLEDGALENALNCRTSCHLPCLE